MSTLKLKNRYDVSFRLLIDKATEKGGVPEFIEVSPQEMYEIFVEMWKMGRKETAFQITQSDSTTSDVQFMIFASGGVSMEDAKSLIKEYARKMFEVEIRVGPRHIPLKLVFPPKAKELEERFTNPGQPRECYSQKPPAPTESSLNTKPQKMSTVEKWWKLK